MRDTTASRMLILRACLIRVVALGTSAVWENKLEENQSCSSGRRFVSAVLRGSSHDSALSAQQSAPVCTPSALSAAQASFHAVRINKLRLTKHQTELSSSEKLLGTEV